MEPVAEHVAALSGRFKLQSRAASTHRARVRAQQQQARILDSIDTVANVCSSRSPTALRTSRRHPWRQALSTGPYVLPLPLTIVQPTVTLVSGGGTVRALNSYESDDPGLFGVDVQLGSTPGTNVFHIQAGTVSADVSIIGL